MAPRQHHTVQHCLPAAIFCSDGCAPAGATALTVYHSGLASKQKSWSYVNHRRKQRDPGAISVLMEPCSVRPALADYTIDIPGSLDLYRALEPSTNLSNMVTAEKVDVLKAGVSTHRHHDSASSPPAYSAVDEPPKEDDDDQSSIADVDSLTSPDYATLEELEQGGPDVDHPFAFPTQELPAYTATKHIDRPLAVPQTHPSPTASFLAAYPPILLSYGIPASTWHDFLATLSSFLNAHAGQNAVFHATKIAQDYGDMHVTLGKDIVAHTESHLRHIGASVKRGNPLAVVSSAVSWPIGLASQIIGTVLQVPAALTQKPQSPRERAEVYVTTANKKWFHARALHAVLVSTPELAEFVAAARPGLLGAVQERRKGSPAEQLEALRPWIGDLSLTPPPPPAPAPSAADPSVVDSQSSAGTGRPELSSMSSSKKLVKGKAKQQAPAAAAAPEPLQLQLGFQTLWVVLVQGSDAKVLGLGRV
nr:hypothetical protein CFP56_33536 [Quercus suber]